MGHFVIESFSNGLDLRRSHDTAPPGSLRVLNNAFVNTGGEIEKRKSFFRHGALDFYGQTGNYKGRITGPFPTAQPAWGNNLSTRQGEVFFRHRHNSLPSGWTAGPGGAAAYITLGTKPPMKAWAMKSAISLGADFGALLHGNATCLFGNFAFLIEQYFSDTITSDDNQNIKVTFDTATGRTDEPTADTRITANDNFPSEVILKSKGYVGGGTRLKASAVLDPGDMAGAGSGTVDTRTQSAPIGTIVGLGEYFGQLAVFGTRGVQFWDVDANFALNQYLRTLAVSVIAPRTITPYGDGDLIFLGRDGITSLRARDSSNLAAVDDVGSPIDKLIQAALNVAAAPSETTDGVTTDLSTHYDYATAAVHPGTGQFWLFLKEKVYVLSVHKDAKVRAWSTFDLPDYIPNNVSTRNGPLKSRWCADVCQISDDLIFRTFADEVFLYGGTTADAYDTSMVEVITPHMDFGKPGIEKTLHGFDIACTGTWKLEVSTNPNNIVWEEIGTFTNSTFAPSGRLPAEGTFTHMALRLTNETAERATLGQVVVYYSGGDER